MHDYFAMAGAVIAHQGFGSGVLDMSLCAIFIRVGIPDAGRTKSKLPLFKIS